MAPARPQGEKERQHPLFVLHSLVVRGRLARCRSDQGVQTLSKVVTFQLTNRDVVLDEVEQLYQKEFSDEE